MLLQVTELGPCRLLLASCLGTRHHLSLSVPLFICGLKMNLSSQGCQSLVVVNLLSALRSLNDTKEG